MEIERWENVSDKLTRPTQHLILTFGSQIKYFGRMTQQWKRTRENIKQSEGTLQSLNSEGILHRLNPDGILHRLNPDGILHRLNPEGILQNLNPEGILHRLNPEGILHRLNPEGILHRLNPEGILQRLNPEANQRGKAAVQSTGQPQVWQTTEFHLTVKHLYASEYSSKIASFAVVVCLVAGLAFCQRRKIRQCFLKYDGTSNTEEHKNRQHTAADPKHSDLNGSPSDKGKIFHDTRKDQGQMAPDSQVQTPNTQIVMRQLSPQPCSPPLQRQLSLPLTPSKQQSNCSQCDEHKCLSLPSGL